MLQSLHPPVGSTLSQACNDPAQQNVNKAPSTSNSTYLESIAIYKNEAAMSGFCAWANDWLDAESSDNTATASLAAGEIAGALQWPASQASDPHDQGALAWFPAAQTAVQNGDTAQVASMFTVGGTGAIAGQCWPYQPAANSDNGTVLVHRSAQDASS
ncbi:MAG: hypothetical protein M0T77_13175 [Actinomycetota bacterium]|nr:hypothetical protein [Actinomycetota bacterium]